MNNTKFAYAVANVRAVENELLNTSFMEQLASSGSYDNACRLLSDKGFSGFETHSDPNVALADYMTKTWDYLMEITPDRDALEFLIVKNDFHNLKAIIKGIVANTDGKKYCIKPCVLDTEDVFNAVKAKDYETLPAWMSGVAEKAYELLTTTLDGQIFDMYVDKASLERMIAFAKNSGYSFCEEFANAFVAVTNIRIALRLSAFTGSHSLLDNAFAYCDGLDVSELKKAVLKGREEVTSFVLGTDYAELIEGSAVSDSMLEKNCDNYLMKMLDEVKRISFGIEPLVAYYYARETEWKNLRITVGAIHAGMSAEAVRERMRELYV